MTVESDHDLSFDTVQIGKDILQRSFVDAEEKGSSPFSQTVFLRATELSTLLQSLNIQNPETATLSLFDIDTILKNVQLVINSVKSESPFTPDIGPNSSVFEAYRLTSFALLAVVNNSTPGKSQLEQENRDLKEQLSKVVVRDATPLLNYIRSEFSISHTDPNLIIKELKRKRRTSRSAEASPSQKQSSDLVRAETKIERLTKQIRSLEELNRTRESELEHLRTSTRTVSTIGFNLDEPERTKFNDVISELSSEVTRLASDLADEAGQNARLLSLVQRQSAALAFAERQAAKSVQIRRGASDGAEVIGLLRTAVDQVFGRSETATEALAILRDSKETPAAKSVQLLELVKSLGERKLVKLTEANGHLSRYLSNLVRFLDQLANSRDIQSWLIDGQPEDDFKPRLVAQLTRVEDFLNGNGLTLASTPLGDGFLQLPDLVLNRLKTDEPEARELLVAVQLLAEVADVNRKFAATLQKQNNELITDRLQLQRELNQQENRGKAVLGEITDATNELKQRVDKYKAKLAHKRQLLSKVVQILQNGEASEAIEASLQELTGTGVPPAVTQKVDTLKAELEHTEKVRDEAIAQATELVKRVDAQEQEIEQVTETCSDLKNTIETQEKQIQKLVATKGQLASTFSKLKQEAEFHKEKNRRDAEEHKSNLARLEQQYKTALAQKDSQLKEELHAADIRRVDEISAIQVKARAKIEKLKRQLAASAEKTALIEEELETERDKLIEKLSASTLSEESTQTQVQRLETQVRRLQAELSTASIEQKKLVASEEKIRREQSLAESRFHTAELSLRAAHEQALAQQQAVFDERYRALIDSVASELSQFIDSPEEVSLEALIQAAATARTGLDATQAKVTELSRADSELKQVRSLLGIPPEKPVIPTVSQLLSKTSWEQWARRIHAIATDNFALSVSPADIQTGLEEALMATQRQSSIARKLEVLRFQKKLLVNGQVVARGISRKLNLNSLISLVRGLRKLQKLAGNTHFTGGSASFGLDTA